MSTKAQFQDTPSFSSTPDNTSTLRYAFRANAAFSLISSLLLLFASNQVAIFLGIQPMQIFGRIPAASFILGLGIGLLGFAAWVGYTATHHPIDRRSATGILVADAAWVVASVLLLVTRALPLTAQGLWAVLIVTDIVLALAIWEFAGIRRLATRRENRV